MTQYRVRRTSHQFRSAWGVEVNGEVVALFLGDDGWTMAHIHCKWLKEREGQQHAQEEVNASGGSTNLLA